MSQRPESRAFHWMTADQGLQSDQPMTHLIMLTSRPQSSVVQRAKIARPKDEAQVLK